MKVKVLATNMTVVKINPDLEIFFSYNTPVAAYRSGSYYRTEQHFSKTTSRHINEYLDGASAISVPQSWFEELGERVGGAAV